MGMGRAAEQNLLGQLTAIVIRMLEGISGRRESGALTKRKVGCHESETDSRGEPICGQSRIRK